MVIGELVPKNWAVSRPLAVARMVAGPQRAFSRAFRPVIELLNRAANRLVRMLGVEPADELASARTPGELVSLARHSARAGALEADTADLFVRTLSLGDLTAENVMTPRVRVSALEDTATAADVLNLTRATGLSRFPVYRERLDDITGMVHLKDALAVPADERGRTRGRPASPSPRCWCPRRCPASSCWNCCAASSRSRSSSTSTAARPAWSPWRTSSRSWSARCATSTTPPTCPNSPRPRPRPAGPPGTPTAAAASTPSPGSAWTRPRARTRRSPDSSPTCWPASPSPVTPRELPGWLLRVEEVGHHRAERVRIVRTGPGDGGGERAMSALQLLFAALLVLGNGFFVGAEFALVSVRRSQIEPLAASHRAARTVIHGLEHLPQMMAAAQFGVTVCSLTLGAVAEPTVAHLLEPVFSAVRVPDGLVHPIGYVLALAVVVFLHLVIGELVPKNLAMSDPEKTALRLGPGLVAFARVFRPVIVVLGACARLILRAFRVEPKDEVDAVFTSAELTVLVEDARAAGLLDSDEQERLEDALELGTRPITEVLLTPDAADHPRPRGDPAAGRGADRTHRLLPLPGRRGGRATGPAISATCTSRTCWTSRTRTGRCRSGCGGR